MPSSISRPVYKGSFLQLPVIETEIRNFFSKKEHQDMYTITVTSEQRTIIKSQSCETVQVICNFAYAGRKQDVRRGREKVT